MDDIRSIATRVVCMELTRLRINVDVISLLDVYVLATKLTFLCHYIIPP